jgi:hypothetical protein
MVFSLGGFRMNNPSRILSSSFEKDKRFMYPDVEMQHLGRQNKNAFNWLNNNYAFQVNKQCSFGKKQTCLILNLGREYRLRGFDQE